MNDIPSVLSMTPGTINTDSFNPITTFNMEGGVAPIAGLGLPFLVVLITGLLFTSIMSSLALAFPPNAITASCCLVCVIIIAAIVYFLQKNSKQIAWAIVAVFVVCALSCCVSAIAMALSGASAANSFAGIFD